MSQRPSAAKPSTPPAVAEHRKALQQYKDTDGHFSLVR